MAVACAKVQQLVKIERAQPLDACGRLQLDVERGQRRRSGCDRLEISALRAVVVGILPVQPILTAAIALGDKLDLVAPDATP